MSTAGAGTAPDSRPTKRKTPASAVRRSGEIAGG